jgi:hypothetical protein
MQSPVANRKASKVMGIQSEEKKKRATNVMSNRGKWKRMKKGTRRARSKSGIRETYESIMQRS